MRILAAAALAVVSIAAAPAERSHAQRTAFQRSHPCPATGKTHGACHGYVVDHVKPLCAGGADRPSNMQWQSVAEGKAKDRAERKRCRQSRAA